jgi:hypothetical protein
VPEVTKYKFETSHKWRIGSAKRPSLTNGEKYEYFKHVYNQK